MKTDNKAELISYIDNRTKNITNDCRTFIWVRFNNEDINDENFRKNKKIGYGNVLQAIGCFCLLEYLAKIYFRIKYPSENWEREKI